MALILPGSARPHNLKSNARYVESDMHDITKRLAEIDESLYLVEFDEPDVAGYLYAIMEACADGTDRLTLKVRPGELDGRVLEKLREMAAVPLHDRIAAFDKMDHAWRADQEEQAFEKLYENFGAHLPGEFYRNGFTDSRPTSYPIVKRK